MTDIFEEVEEQLRSDRYKTLALKAVPWAAAILALALVVALAVWGLGARRTQTDARASDSYAAGLATLQAGDKAKAYGQFETAAKAGSKGYRALALMQQGGIRLSDRRTADAVTLFDAAAKAAPSPLIGDAARLQAAYALMDTANLAEIDGRLKPLAEADRPYRTQAREALAMAKLSHGQGKAARDDFALLITGLDTPNGVRQRAQAAQALIDSGGSANIAAIVKASQALPAGFPTMGAPAVPQASPTPSTPPAGAGQ